MTRSAIVLLSLTAAALLPSSAAAQTYAGGSIGAGSSANAPGTSELGIHVHEGRISIRGAAVIRCAGGRTSEVEGLARGTLQPDGTFRVQFSRGRLQLTTTPNFRRTVVFTGQVRGGEITGRLDATAGGGNVRGCRGAFDWVARVTPELANDPAAVPAGRTLIGKSSQVPGGPFAVNLRVGSGGDRITQFVAGSRYDCRRLRPYQETNYSPTINIRPDGTFFKEERFKVRFSDVVDSVKVTTTGRFVNGGAIGTWRAQSVSRSRKTGAVVDRCGTGQVLWSASIL